MKTEEILSLLKDARDFIDMSKFNCRELESEDSKNVESRINTAISDLEKEKGLQDESYSIITWPNIQHFMTEEGFRENSHLINDENGMRTFGSSAYFIKNMWLNEITLANPELFHYI